MQAGDLKNGTRVELDGDPCVVLDVARRSPSARGAATLINARFRNLRTRQQVTRSFKATDSLKQPDFEVRMWTFLYSEGADLHHFMDQDNYEQHALPREMIDYELGFLLPDSTVRAQIFNGECIGIELENTVVLEIVECDPGVKGDTVTNTTKSARLETGLSIQVPLFVEQGDRVQVDTRDARYLRRG